VALTLARASREKADAFLDRQSALIEKQTILTDLQARELSHELDLRHWSLWVRHVSGVLKLTLELSVGLLLLTLVAGIGLMVWNAAHADGLIVESFSVPPDQWGEALFYLGRRDEAAKQFARAAQLGLTPSERTELMGISRH
jgi:hypothetical protein